MTKDEKEMKEHLNKYDKDTLIELYLQAKFDEKVRIAELEREVAQLKDMLSTGEQKQYQRAINAGAIIPRKPVEVLMKEADEFRLNLRHEICEKIRNKAFATEAFCDDKSEIVKYTIYADDLDQIERGEE